jgi:hypothetical protein
VYHIPNYMSTHFAASGGSKEKKGMIGDTPHPGKGLRPLHSAFLKFAPTIDGAAQGAFVGIFQVSSVGEAARQAGDTHLEGL